MNPQREYRFLEQTISLCPDCLMRVDAKIILKKSSIYLLKFCPVHGPQEELLEKDGAYYLERMKFDKPATVSKTQTVRTLGCPFDCGLCPEHEQHTCNGLIEITSDCDLKCPVCYAESGKGKHLPLEKIDAMLDFFVDSEFGGAEILQISGGEPTRHPDIIEILRRAKEKKIKYVLLNTNGLRMAEDDAFVKNLSQFIGGFEVYFQFDGFDPKTDQQLRGRIVSEIKQTAIRKLEQYNIPVTLVTTAQAGVNDHEIGRILEYGIKAKNVRGINFQPVAFFGRHNGARIENRTTLTGILEAIEKQSGGMLLKKDFFALPCDVDRVAITYLYKTKRGFLPLTRNFKAEKHLSVIQNTFRFDPDDFLKNLAKNIFSASCCDYLGFFAKLNKLIPKSYFLKTEQEKVAYVSENTFRISVTSFLDAYNFDMKSMKKECVHIITPDLKKIPFSAYNILYRNPKKEAETVSA